MEWTCLECEADNYLCECENVLDNLIKKMGKEIQELTRLVIEMCDYYDCINCKHPDITNMRCEELVNEKNCPVLNTKEKHNDNEFLYLRPFNSKTKVKNLEEELKTIWDMVSRCHAKYEEKRLILSAIRRLIPKE